MRRWRRAGKAAVEIKGAVHGPEERGGHSICQHGCSKMIRPHQGLLTSSVIVVEVLDGFRLTAGDVACGKRKKCFRANDLAYR